MKKIYLIQTSIKNNEAFTEKIKSLGSWLKYFSDNWIVESTMTAHEIYDNLSNGYEEDNIFIIEISKTNYWGRMNSKVWDYFKERK